MYLKTSQEPKPQKLLTGFVWCLCKSQLICFHFGCFMLRSSMCVVVIPGKWRWHPQNSTILTQNFIAEIWLEIPLNHQTSGTNWVPFVTRRERCWFQFWWSTFLLKTWFVALDNRTPRTRILVSVRVHCLQELCVRVEERLDAMCRSDRINHCWRITNGKLPGGARSLSLDCFPQVDSRFCCKNLSFSECRN